MQSISTIIGYAVPVVVGAEMLVFLFGLLKFLVSGTDEEAQKDGRRFMVYGVVSLFVMLSVWGLVGVINQLTGINQGGSGNLPKLPQ